MPMACDYEGRGQHNVSTACILFFGKNPQRFFSRVRTRFISYEGTEEKVGTEMNVVKEKSAVSLPRETITIW
jgi:ATP-dependent DNA helicase RecG